MEEDITVREALTRWRSFWHTEYSDDLVLTGKQADELCTLLDIPFDDDSDSVYAEVE